MRRFVATFTLAVVLLAVLAPLAFGVDNGEGLYGETNDKVVTNAGFIVIIFFPLFVATMSALQWALERRKKRKKTTLPPHTWQGGW